MNERLDLIEWVEYEDPTGHFLRHHCGTTLNLPTWMKRDTIQEFKTKHLGECEYE